MSSQADSCQTLNYWQRLFSRVGTRPKSIDAISAFKKCAHRVEHTLLIFEDDVKICFDCAIEHERRRFVQQMMVQASKPRPRGGLIISTR
jgi:hypothetical protein